jgi:metal-responsive CopG/Arc/MetJ family transcriptional regulator
MTTTIEIEIEESLLDEVDEVVAQIGISREVYIITAIKHTLRRYRPRDLSADDEINAFRLWMIDDGEGDEWRGMREWDDPLDGPGDDRLN